MAHEQPRAHKATAMNEATKIEGERRKNLKHQRITKCSSSITMMWMIATLSMGAMLWATVDHEWAAANVGIALAAAAMVKNATGGEKKSKAITMAMGMLQLQRGMAGMEVAWGEGLMSAMASATSSTLPAMSSVLWSVHQLVSQMSSKEEIMMDNLGEKSMQMTMPAMHHITWGEMAAVMVAMTVTISMCCAASGTHRAIRNSYLKMATMWNLLAWVAMQLVPVIAMVASQSRLWWQPSLAMLEVWKHGWEHALAITVIAVWIAKSTVMKMFQSMTKMNSSYWLRIAREELKHELEESGKIQLQGSDGKLKKFVLQLSHHDECCASPSCKNNSTAKIEMNTEFGACSCILDSGCGPNMFPSSWVQRAGETAGLRPSGVRMRAASGNAMKMAGALPMKVRVPGTNGWMVQNAEITARGGMPDHIRILGNDFAKSVKGKLDWETETFSGITPSGEPFCIPVDFTKQNQNNCVNVVESTRDKDGKSVCSKITMYATEDVALEPNTLIKAHTASLGETEGEEGTYIWEPRTMCISTLEAEKGNEEDEVSFASSVEAVITIKRNAITNALEVTHYVRNPTDQQVIIPKGTALGDITKVEVGNPEEFEEFMAEQNESDRIARGGNKSTMWKGSQIPRWLWILALVMGLYAMWSLIAVDGATSIVQSAFKAGVTTEDDWACSMQTEEIQSKASRHTTVRHKPKTRLNNKDKRKNESGEQTVSRVRKKIRTDSKFKDRYDKWCREIAKQFCYGEGLEEGRKQELLALLYGYQELFISNPKAPPPIDGIEYALYFRNNDPIPVRMKVPRLSPAQMEHMEKETMEMLRNYIIQFSDSEWATRPVFAKKKDNADGTPGGWRFAIDFRQLNDQLLADAQTLPNIPETLEGLSRAKLFSAFDACAGFWGIRVRPKDRQYTAFHGIYQGSWHLFEWLRMPFGLKSATATFQRMFMRIMGKGDCICKGGDAGPHSRECEEGCVALINKICKIFVDDGIVYTENESSDEEAIHVAHLNDMAKVFKRLSANGISLKACKCVWCSKEIPLLGHKVVAGEGIKIDQSKVDAILQMSAPKTSDMLKKFLGMTGYLQKFVPRFAEYADPLRRISNQFPGKRVEEIGELWTEEAQAAFDALKVALANAAILHFPDYEKPFIIAVDASNGILGGTLMQLDEEGIERPIAYASTMLSKAEKNYGITHKEGLGVTWAVKKWAQYLHNNVCIVITDHSSLTSLTNPKKEFDNARMARYALLLSEYDILIAHRAGEELITPDMLSRAEHLEDKEEIKKLFAQAVGDEAQLAMQISGNLREQLLSKESQQGRLHRRVTAAEVRDAMVNSKADSVLEAVSAIIAGTITPKERQVMEHEESDRVDKFYDMICTATHKEARAEVDAESDYEDDSDEEMDDNQVKKATVMMEPSLEDFAPKEAPTTSEEDEGYIIDGATVSWEAIVKDQLSDKFSMNMYRHLRTNGEWLPDDKEEAKQCAAWSPTMTMHKGVLCRIKIRRNKHGAHSTLDPTMQMYIPKNSEVKTAIIRAVHKELAHPGITRTYQAINDKFFWKGMCTDIIHEVQRCTVCQFHSPKARKAPIQGHVEAKAPAEMITMDMVHMLNADGYEYLLNVVDVYSKYGMSIPLKEATSQSVVEALRDHVLVHGFGRPKYWIVDGGSEFKEVFAETVKAWGAQLHDSAPNHPQSHGAIEKFNRSLENKMAKLNSQQKDGSWMDVRAAAVEAINNSVHATLSDGESVLSPAEVWFARRPVLSSIPNLRIAVPKKMSEMARQLMDQWNGIKRHVSQSMGDYKKSMKKHDRNKNTPLRKFEIGDEVTLYQPTKSKKMNKISPMQRGPYRIMEVDASGVGYKIHRVGSSNKRDTRKVHVDEIRKLRRFDSEEAGECFNGPMKAPAKDRSKAYQVEMIAGERGGSKSKSATTQSKQKQFLVKWEGYNEATWEPEENLSGCPDKITEWISLSQAERRKLFKRTQRVGIVAAIGEAEESDDVEELKDLIALIRADRFICFDLASCEDVIEEVICRAGEELSQVAAFLLSPPCETYSPTDATNSSESKMCHYRDHSIQDRPPRSLDSCKTAADFKKREVAMRHDKMMECLIAALIKHKHYGYDVILENPMGSLARKTFMNQTDWTTWVARRKVDYCAYGMKYRKSTHIWTTLLDWVPKGNTGNGVCGGKCGQLMERDSHKGERKRNNSWSRKHIECIGGAANRLPMGPKRKQQLWKLPVLLQEELMEVLSNKHDSKKVIFDFFSGGESWKETVENSGFTYVPVDVRQATQAA